VVIGAHCIGSCKSNYHKITTIKIISLRNGIKCKTLNNTMHDETGWNIVVPGVCLDDGSYDQRIKLIISD
jgi:hypothetical protein